METWGGSQVFKILKKGGGRKNELLLRGGSFKIILMLVQLLVHSINRLEKIVPCLVQILY